MNDEKLMPYNPPEVLFWSASQLDEVQACMSGGYGGGGLDGGYQDALARTLYSSFDFQTVFQANLISSVWNRVCLYHTPSTQVANAWGICRFLGETVYGGGWSHWDVFAGILVAGDYYGESYCTFTLKMGQYYAAVANSVACASSSDYIDFAHMMMTMAGMLAADCGINMSAANSITRTYLDTIPELSVQKQREGLIGWLGDSVLDGGVFGKGDFNADLDAVNIVAMIRSGASFDVAMRQYYDSMAADRVNLFMNNIGLTWEGFEDVILRAGRVYYANESRAKREERLKKAYSSAYNNFIVRLKCA